jgi:hypothetical protein
MVVFDAATLLLLLRPDAGRPLDPATGTPVERVEERMAYLVQRLEKARSKILIPTPALSEVLVRAGAAGPETLERIQRSAAFRIVPFDTLAAVEVAAMTRRALDAGDKRAGGSGVWAKIKYDRQIVAIAKVERASAIYSDDENVRRYGRDLALPVIGVADLELPPEAAQVELALPPPGVPEREEEQREQFEDLTNSERDDD